MTGSGEGGYPSWPMVGRVARKVMGKARGKTFAGDLKHRAGVRRGGSSRGPVVADLEGARLVFQRPQVLRALEPLAPLKSTRAEKPESPRRMRRAPLVWLRASHASAASLCPRASGASGGSAVCVAPTLRGIRRRACCSKGSRNASLGPAMTRAMSSSPKHLCMFRA